MGGPVEEPISRAVIGIALDINGAFGILLFRERVFIVAKGHRLTRGVLEMWVVHGNLGKIGVCWAAEGVRENKMERNASSGHHSFCFPNSIRETRYRKRSVAEVLEDVEGRSTICRKS